MTPEKRCSGPCGLLLPRSSFYLTGRGNTQGRCKDCHREEARLAYRFRYRADETFRAAELARSNAKYQGRTA
jgi:hypothetical protein